MGARGPKSSPELTAIGPGGTAVARRLSPPADLTPEQAEVRRGIVNSQPADWFTPGSAPVLAAVCRPTVAARRLASWLVRLKKAEEALDEDRWFRLLARQEADSKAVAALATRLRLTPQTRYTPHGSTSAGRKRHDGPRPWEWARSKRPRSAWAPYAPRAPLPLVPRQGTAG